MIFKNADQKRDLKAKPNDDGQPKSDFDENEEQKRLEELENQLGDLELDTIVTKSRLNEKKIKNISDPVMKRPFFCTFEHLSCEKRHEINFSVEKTDTTRQFFMSAIKFCDETHQIAKFYSSES